MVMVIAEVGLLMFLGCDVIVGLVVGRSGCENHNCGRHSRCEEQGDSYTCVCLDGYKKTDSGRCKKGKSPIIP